MSKKPELIAYVAKEGKDDKSFFTRIGAAWTNTKGGYNIRLDALPVNGVFAGLEFGEEIQINRMARIYSPWEIRMFYNASCHVSRASY